jgi:hypothetical protein
MNKRTARNGWESAWSTLMNTRLKTRFLITDGSFIVYWTITALHLLPPSFLFNDYTNPILVAWNWSFLPLDLLISATGIASGYLARRGAAAWRNLALVSLVLTMCSGLQAIAFWTLRQDFDLTWWLPNVYLLYPLFFVPALLRGGNHATRTALSAARQHA